MSTPSNIGRPSGHYNGQGGRIKPFVNSRGPRVAVIVGSTHLGVYREGTKRLANILARLVVPYRLEMIEPRALPARVIPHMTRLMTPRFSFPKGATRNE